jgi:hypothetical protein
MSEDIYEVMREIDKNFAKLEHSLDIIEKAFNANEEKVDNIDINKKCITIARPNGKGKDI